MPRGRGAAINCSNRLGTSKQKIQETEANDGSLEIKSSNRERVLGDGGFLLAGKVALVASLEKLFR